VPKAEMPVADRGGGFLWGSAVAIDVAWGRLSWRTQTRVRLILGLRVPPALDRARLWRVRKLFAV
jgi:hypothetical protein